MLYPLNENFLFFVDETMDFLPPAELLISRSSSPLDFFLFELQRE
jgi:hypothetical protein